MFSGFIVLFQLIKPEAIKFKNFSLQKKMKMEEGMEFTIEDLETRKVNIFPINDQTY